MRGPHLFLRFLSMLVVAGAPLLPAAAMAQGAARPLKPAVKLDDCSRQAVTAEHALGLPAGLLLAIAVVESGYDGRPHPYALHIGGKSSYPERFDTAAAMLDEALAGAARNINVGCMQLSYASHVAAFKAPHDILLPAANVRHAALLLRQAYRASKSWTVALERYQGGSARQRKAYVCRIWLHVRVLAPATASKLDARHCKRGGRVRISPALVRASHLLRRSLIDG